MEFGEVLKELRKERGLTQVQLADVFFVAQTTIKDWEINGVEPNYATLKKIAAFFDVSIDHLLDYKTKNLK